MKTAEVVNISGTPPEEGAGAPANDAAPEPLAIPGHFKSKRLREAWADLLDAAAPELKVRANRFTFEFAALLMAKMRAGKPMTATESKELKKHMIALGLAKDDDDGKGKAKGKNAAKYFDRGDS